MAKSSKEAVGSSPWDEFDSLVKKEFGEGVLMDENTKLDIDRTSTGSLGLDIALGGGLAVGKWVEVFADTGSGKTTLAIHAMVQNQIKFPDRAVAIIDYEHAFDINYAKALGLDTSPSKFRISQPEDAEQGMDLMRRMLESGLFSFVVVDSIAGMVPRKELEGEIGDASMGLHARLMSKASRSYKGISNKSNTTVYWINQTREKIGAYGNPLTTPGGNAMKFYADQRIELSKSVKDAIKDGVVHVSAKVIKNKFSAPFKTADYDIIFGEGISRGSEILESSLRLGMIKQSGAWFSLVADGKNIAQGRDATIKVLEGTPELSNELEKIILDHYFNDGEEGISSEE